MKPIALNLGEANGLGDLISSTPTIKKVSEAYQQKITVLSKFPELFKENPYVEKSYKISSVDMEYFNEHYTIHNSFYNVGKKNERGIEYKHNRIDIRQFHAINLGFQLGADELECFYKPTESNRFDYKDYVVIHPVQTWETRTWAEQNWIELINSLNDLNIRVIAIGKDSSETGFFNVNKPIFDLQIANGLFINLMNQTSISDCWHLIENSKGVVTMDSGILHLAGTTTAPIIHLGSNLKPEFRIPYRNNSQTWMYQYIAGECNAQCGSDMKYGIKFWDNIQGVPPLIKCLEERPKYDCHPIVSKVLNAITTIL